MILSQNDNNTGNVRLKRPYNPEFEYELMSFFFALSTDMPRNKDQPIEKQ